MEVGEFVVAGVGDLFFAEVEVKGVGDEDGFCKGLVEADLFHVAGVFDADVRDTEQPAHLCRVHGTVAKGYVGPGFKKHPKHPVIELQQPP